MATSQPQPPENIYDELAWRGLVYDGTEGVREHLASGSRSVYIGFDPTAASLHVGSLLQILALARMQRFGHRPIALVGGGTGMIGDPSGKTAERSLLDRETVAHNLAGIRSQLERFLDFEGDAAARLVDNDEWLGSLPLIDFLRDVGKHFTVNAMVAKESVKRRMASEVGISYTEFSYSLLQSYDYLVLHDRFDCTLQMGASDQWGNIVTGADLIRRVRQSRAYGLVSPLVMSSTGVKFGKTESGTVWLDAERTSPYRFHQFWLNTPDDSVVTYLKFFTFLGQGEIEDLAARHADAPQAREAQRVLADAVTRMVHGEEALEQATQGAKVLFGGDLQSLPFASLRDVLDDVPSTRWEGAGAETGEGAEDPSDAPSVLDLLVLSGLAKSRGAARRLVREGGAYLNNQRVGDESATVGEDDWLGGELVVLRKGRKAYHVIQRGTAASAGDSA